MFNITGPQGPPKKGLSVRPDHQISHFLRMGRCAHREGISRDYSMCTPLHRGVHIEADCLCLSSYNKDSLVLNKILPTNRINRVTVVGGCGVVTKPARTRTSNKIHFVFYVTEKQWRKNFRQKFNFQP